MKKLGLVLAAMFFCTTILVSFAFAVDKFAYIDLSKTFSEYKKTKDYDKSLGDKEKTYTAERDKRVNDVKQLQDKLNLLSDKEKETKKTEIETKIKNLQEYDQQKQTDLRKEQEEKMKEILKDIEEAVKECAVKEGYTMVFNDRVLVYQDKTMDITDKILVVLNKSTPVKK